MKTYTFGSKPKSVGKDDEQIGKIIFLYLVQSKTQKNSVLLLAAQSDVPLGVLHMLACVFQICLAGGRPGLWSGPNGLTSGPKQA